MTMRTRSSEAEKWKGTFDSYQETTYFPSDPDTVTRFSGTNEFNHTGFARSETISDVKPEPHQKSALRKARRLIASQWRASLRPSERHALRIARSAKLTDEDRIALRLGLSESTPECKPVLHVKEHLTATGERTEAFFKENLPTSETSLTYTDRELSFLHRITSGSEDPVTRFKSVSPSYTSQSYLTHDWQALLDQFNERCDALMPQGLLVGETIAEARIYVDLFKIVTNPLSAVRSLGNLLKGDKLRHSRLGHLANIAKETNNAQIGYRFGIQPALKDALSALTAINAVNRRIAYLKEQRGGYVPIRVRRSLSSDISNEDFAGDSQYYYYPEVKRLCDEKVTIACISAWAKVREDLDFEDTWRYYAEYFGLNKIVGVAWELVPFSFIVDWFTNTQELINTLTRINSRSPYSEFRSFSASEKRILKETLYVRPYGYETSFGGFGSNPKSPYPVCTLSTSRYERFQKIPDASGVVDLSTLGSFHLWAAGSLILQRVLR